MLAQPYFLSQREFSVKPERRFYRFWFYDVWHIQPGVLPMFYKTAIKVGIPTIIGILAATVFALGVELTALFVPWAKSAFDTPNPATVGLKIATLLVGMAFFILMTYAAYRMSAKRFERIDL